MVHSYLSVLVVLVVCNSVCNCCTVREQLKELTKQYDKSENDLKALQSVGQVAHNLTLPVSLHLTVLTCLLMSSLLVSKQHLNHIYIISSGRCA